MPEYLIRAWKAETEDEDNTEVDDWFEGENLAEALREAAARLDG